jgi:hypothetical protein
MALISVHNYEYGAKMDKNQNPKKKSSQGRWISDGGRLHWITGQDNDSDALDAHELGLTDDSPEAISLEENDDDLWASDNPPLPPGAPEIVRIQAAHAWLNRQISYLQEQISVLTLEEYQNQRQRDEDARSNPRRRKQPIELSPLVVQIAFYESARDWYMLALTELDDLSERSSGRAIVEWYLWLTTQRDLSSSESEDRIEQSRGSGRIMATEETQRHIERLVAPDLEED